MVGSEGKQVNSVPPDKLWSPRNAAHTRESVLGVTSSARNDGRPGVVVDLIHGADVLCFPDVVGLIDTIFFYPEVPHSEFRDGEDGILDGSGKIIRKRIR